MLIFLWRRFGAHRSGPSRLFRALTALLAIVVARRLGQHKCLGRSPICRATCSAAGLDRLASWTWPAWSISAEWLAYGLFPVFVALMRPARTATCRRRSPRASVACWRFRFAYSAHNVRAAALLRWPAALPVLARDCAMSMLGHPPGPRLQAVTGVRCCCHLCACRVLCRRCLWSWCVSAAIGIAVPAIMGKGRKRRQWSRTFVSTRPMVVLFRHHLLLDLHGEHFLVLMIVQNVNFQLGLEQPAPASRLAVSHA